MCWSEVTQTHTHTCILTLTPPSPLPAGRLGCWGEITRLVWDPATRTSSSPPGVSIRVPGFGDTDTVEFIDPTWIAWASGNIGTYASPFIERKCENAFALLFPVWMRYAFYPQAYRIQRARSGPTKELTLPN